jgi:hypothetical protein
MRLAVLRFGARASARVPAVWEGSSVTVWCDVLDVQTRADAAASGVALRWLAPDGQELRMDAIPDGDAWRGTLALAVAGEWRIRAEVGGGALVAEASLIVAPSAFDPDASATPVLVTDDGEVLVLDDGEAMGA